MAYLGNVGDKITVEVVMSNIYEYEDYSFNYRGTTHYIYSMTDSDGNVLVWKTTKCMSEQVKAGHWHYVRKGDRLQITGSVKEHSVYKETEQTVLQRVKVKFLEIALSWEEKQSIKQEEQLSSLTGGDFVWEMPYKQYKEHYSDCETVANSFQARDIRTDKPSMISVIIREGRLKNSGVRGMHFCGYMMENEEGRKITYRAVSEENALKRVLKEFPNHEWKCTQVFEYLGRW